MKKGTNEKMEIGQKLKEIEKNGSIAKKWKLEKNKKK